MADERPCKRFRQSSPSDAAAQDAGVEVDIRSVSGEQVGTLHLTAACPALRAKRSIEGSLGFPWASQELLHRDAIVQDDTLLSSLHAPLTLTLVLRPFSKVRALREAIFAGHEAAVRSLLKRAACHQEETYEMLFDRDRAPLGFAAAHGHEGICRALLEAAPSDEARGLMLEACDGLGQTALSFVAGHGQAAMCKLLLDAAPSAQVHSTMLHATNQINGDTALHRAAARGHELVCRVLLDATPDVEPRTKLLTDTADESGETALHYAAERGHEIICRALLEAAPSPEARCELLGAQSSSGRTALDVAGRHGHEATSQLLVGMGAVIGHKT